MGTISDKLMRIINTKEDIRQALISKGYDVPTSIPFKEYAKMILDLPCKVDSFPDIEGIVARYSASGLTNEQMAANPVWVDKTGNGYDLQMKNFFWGGMSGVGGYVDNWNSSADWAVNSYWVNSHTDHKLQFITASTVVQVKSKNVYNAENVYKNILNVNGLTEAVNKGAVGSLKIFVTDSITSKVIKIFSFETDGVIQISFDDVLQDYYVNYFVTGNNTNDIDITIEQLPLYPGALVFDGVDDYGVCDNFPILTKEKGYTVVVLRQLDQDFLNTTLTGGLLSTRNYSTGEGVAFEKIESSNKGYWNLGAGGIIDFAKSPFTWQTSKQYNNVGILKGDKNHGKPLCVGCGLSGGQQCGRFAIWELVFLDHDATEEELTKIKDYFVKTYPWLFPDQAWTVTGKTNEDEDRATIANITGNGNDLVLSNFGFAKGSGYGLYYQYFGEKFATTNGEIEDGGWNKIDNYNISHNKRIPINSIGKCYWSNEVFANGIKLRFKLTGMTEGDVLAFGYAGTYDLTYTSDGIYVIDLPPVDKTYGFSLQSSLTENLPTTPVTIKLLPFEYEGYLVTDGVDDKINSSNFDLGKDWTIVGDWTMLSNIPSNCGIIKASSLFLYNSIDSVTIYINNGGRPIKIQSKSINAICSDGRIYLNDWTEISKPGVQTELGSKANLNITSYGTTFTKMAFKNLAIYDGKILSKDECIKAYNYLQTLKSK
jgi:hypothetical protein